MKLYTEEQVREALKAGFRFNGNRWRINDYTELFINALTPIELPSDEEIGKGRDENIPIDEKNMWSERFYFNVGAKWVIEQIKKHK